MIDDRRWGDCVFPKAFHAQRMPLKILLSGFTPFGVIPAGSGAAALGVG